MCETNARLTGKVAIVTGGNSGIGFEAAKDLAEKGARVILASRDEAKLKAARDNIVQATGNNDIAYRRIDLISLKSVRNFAEETARAETRLDILINNAGAIGLPDKLTEDDLNLTMQVNYFGMFLLTYLLLPLLKSSAPSRIINSSASSMYLGHLEFDHWNDIGRYNAITALANSKLAVTLFTAELDSRLKGTGVTANTFDPFVVRNTEILRNVPEVLKGVSQFFVDTVGQTKEYAGQQIAYLAAEPSLETVSGQNFKLCKVWINHWLVSDVKLREELWKASKDAVKITPGEDWEISDHLIHKSLYLPSVKFTGYHYITING